MFTKTAAAAQDLIERKRASLATLATEGAAIRDITHTVNEIARTEGEWTVLATDEKMAANGLDTAERIEVITDLLLRGADDSWSGRGNDTQRAHYDGIRDAASTVLNRLRAQN